MHRKGAGRAYIKSKAHYCCFCGKSIKGIATIEHIIPKSKNGSNHFSNLTASCLPCNSSRGNKTEILPKYHITTGHLLAHYEVKEIMRRAMSRMARRKEPETQIAAARAAVQEEG